MKHKDFILHFPLPIAGCPDLALCLFLSLSTFENYSRRKIGVFFWAKPDFFKYM